jgi:hypothetical protein
MRDAVVGEGPVYAEKYEGVRCKMIVYKVNSKEQSPLPLNSTRLFFAPSGNSPLYRTEVK